MDIKLFEIRDVATFIPAMGIKLHPRIDAERYLLARAGYGLSVESQDEYVLLAKLAGGTDKMTCDPYEWVGNSTMQVAHTHIQMDWDNLVSGDVIDVEYIRGTSQTRKESEMFTAGL